MTLTESKTTLNRYLHYYRRVGIRNLGFKIKSEFQVKLYNWFVGTIQKTVFIKSCESLPKLIKQKGLI